MALQGKRLASHTGSLAKSDSAVKYLEEHCLNVQGPRACLSGLRKQIWGNNAYVIKCGNYLYKVSEDVFNYLIP